MTTFTPHLLEPRTSTGFVHLSPTLGTFLSNVLTSQSVGVHRLADTRREDDERTESPPTSVTTPTPPDAELLGRIAAGDRQALSALYAEHAGWLMIRLERRCGDPEIADLALQDTFVAVWKSARNWRGEGDVGAWIWGIASRRLIDQLRKRRPTPVEDPHASAGAAAVDAPSAEDIALDRRLSGPIARAVGRLDPDVRTVFLAANLDGLTTKEIGRLHGIPQGTVKTRLARARRQLQSDLAPTVDPSPPDKNRQDVA